MEEGRIKSDEAKEVETKCWLEKKYFLYLALCDGQNMRLLRMTLKKKDSDGRDSAPNAAKTSRG